MKKILLATAAAAVLSSFSASAAEEGTFYGKVFGGWSKLADSKVVYTDKSDKLKTKGVAFAGVSVGYHMMDNVRLETAVEYFFNSKRELNDKKFKFEDIEGKISAVQKVDIKNFQVNGFVDLYDASVAKFFVGAGVGVARVTKQLKLNYDLVSGGKSGDTEIRRSDKKNYTDINFSYGLYAGVSTEFSEGVHAEIMYGWKDLGSVKKAKETITINGKKKDLYIKSTPLNGHHVSVGLRFDF